MVTPRAADDFAAIRGRRDEIVRERLLPAGLDPEDASAEQPLAVVDRPRRLRLSDPHQEPLPPVDAIVAEASDLLVKSDGRAFVLWTTNPHSLFAKWEILKYWAIDDLRTRIELDDGLQDAISDGDHQVNASMKLTLRSVEIIESEKILELEIWQLLREAIRRFCQSNTNLTAIDQRIYQRADRYYDPPDLIITTNDFVPLVESDTKFRYDHYRRTLSPLISKFKPAPKIVNLGYLSEDFDQSPGDISIIARHQNPCFSILRSVDTLLSELQGPPCLTVVAQPQIDTRSE